MDFIAILYHFLDTGLRFVSDILKQLQITLPEDIVCVSTISSTCR